MIPLLYKFAAIIAVFVCIVIVVTIKLGGWVDDNYGTLALVCFIVLFVVLAVAGLVFLLIAIIPYLV